MTTYAITVMEWEDGVYLQRKSQTRGYESPLAALYEFTNTAVASRGFDNIAYATCFDEQHGIEQWRIEIR